MKNKIFIDFDETIVATNKAFCATYNSIFKDVEGFIHADYNQCNCWDYKDVCPLLENREDVETVFRSVEFFKTLTMIDDNMASVLQELITQYEVIICTIGNPGNLALKSVWIQKHLPYISQVILMSNSNCIMDKSNIQMEDCIFIDDNINNLNSSNASKKICYGKEYKWNKEWDGLRALDSKELLTMITENK